MTDVDTAIASVASLGLVAPEWWPAVAVELLLLGDQRDVVAELASMPSSVTYWDVEPFAVAIVTQTGPPPARDVAISNLVGLLVQSFRVAPCAVEFPLIRTLAALSDALGYPTQLMSAFYAEEFLDSDCHEPDSEALESKLMAHPTLCVPNGLALALIAHARRRHCAVQR